MVFFIAFRERKSNSFKYPNFTQIDQRVTSNAFYNYKCNARDRNREVCLVSESQVTMKNLKCFTPTQISTSSLSHSILSFSLVLTHSQFLIRFIQLTDAKFRYTMLVSTAHRAKIVNDSVEKRTVAKNSSIVIEELLWQH